jgi:hypothetical protein
VYKSANSRGSQQIIPDLKPLDLQKACQIRRKPGFMH